MEPSDTIKQVIETRDCVQTKVWSHYNLLI